MTGALTMHTPLGAPASSRLWTPDGRLFVATAAAARTCRLEAAVDLAT